jgi:hypothetical protein
MSSIRNSNDSLNSFQNINRKIVCKSDDNRAKNNNKLLFNDSISIESTQQIKSEIQDENIEIPKLINNAIKNSYV